MLYPKMADTDGNVLEPVTVTVVPGPPDEGPLVSVEVPVVVVTVKVPAWCTVGLLPPIVTQTGYPVFTVHVPDGQENGSLNEPLASVFAELIVVVVLQPVVVPYPIVTELLITQLLAPSTTLLPLRVTDVPGPPDVGLSVNDCAPEHAAAGAACAGDAAPQPSAVSANASTAKHTISAMLVETIFDRFTPVFMLPSPKGPS